MNLTPEQAKIFEQALELISLEERHSFLEEACQGDAELRSWIDMMLEGNDGSTRFLPAETDRTELTSESDTEYVGCQIGRYKLLQQIGEGGFGLVYMAEQSEPIRRKVALKIIKLGMDTKQVVARFESERQALALMDHPYIAKVLDAGATNSGRPFFVMELVNGVPITDFCNEQRLSIQQRLALFEKVCSGVQHAHQKGIIHRDLKPSNILVTLDGDTPVPRVIDFGIAKATQQRLTEKTVFTQYQQFIGTPAYMSPEQANISALDIDTRTDVYSLGVLLYELLVGAPPFENRELLSKGYDEIRRVIREDNIPRPSKKLITLDEPTQASTAQQRNIAPAELVSVLNGDLERVILKALAKDRTERYESPQHFAEDVDRFLNARPVRAVAPTLYYLLRKFVIRHRTAVLIASAFILVLLAATLFSTRQAFIATEAQGRAEASEQIAQDREKEAREQLIGTWLERGRAAYLDGNPNLGLSWYAWAFRSDPSHPSLVDGLVTALRYREIARPTSDWLQHDAPIWWTEFSPDGSKLVTASEDNTAKIWDTNTGTQIGLTMQHQGEIRPARFSPDGRFIATASRDGTATIWDASTGRPVSQPFGTGEPIFHISFSPDSTRVITASRDHTAQIWETANGRPQGTVLRHKGPVRWVEFSRDGQFIVTASEDQTARVWRSNGPSPLSRPLHHRGTVRFATFSPTGSTLFTFSEGTMKVWDLKTSERPAAEYKHENARVVCVSPDGTRFAMASNSGRITIWESSQGSDPTHFKLSLSFTQPEASVWHLTFDPSGRRIMAASNHAGTQIWDITTGRPITPPFQHHDAIHHASFSPDGLQVATGGNDYSARIWDARRRINHQIGLDHGEGVITVALNSSGTRALTAGMDGTAQVWDLQTSSPLGPKLRHDGGYYGILTAEFSPDDSRILTAGWDQTARIWQADDLAATPIILPHEDSVEFATFSPEGRFVGTASNGGSGHIWNAETGEQAFPPTLHTHRVLKVAFSPDGTKFATQSWDHSAKLRDLTTGRIIGAPMQHPDKLSDLAFHPNGSLIVTACFDGKLRLWDSKTAQLKGAPIRGGFGYARVQFSPTGDYVAANSGTQDFQLWSIDSRQKVSLPLRNIEGVRNAYFVQPNDNRLLTRSPAKDRYEGTFQLWDLKSGFAIGPPFGDGPDFSQAASLNLATGHLVSGDLKNGSVHQFVSAPIPAPLELALFAESIAGLRITENGFSEEPVPFTRIKALHAQVESSKSLDYYTQLMKWCISKDPQRSLIPMSSQRITDHIQALLRLDTPQTLDLVHQISPTNGVALARLAYHELEQSKSLNDASIRRGGFLLKQAQQFAPNHIQTKLTTTHLKILKGEDTIAATLLDELMQEDDAGSDVWALASLLAEKQNQPEESLRFLDQALKRISRSAYEQRLPLLNRRHKLLLVLNQHDRATQDWQEMLNLPARPDHLPPQQLDLTDYYSQALTTPWGVQEGNLNRFEIREQPNPYDARGIITLYGEFDARQKRLFPKSVTGIPVSQTASKISVVHGARNENRSTVFGTAIAHYDLNYADGSKHSIPVEAGIHIRDWRYTPGNPTHEEENRRLNVIWSGANTAIRYAGEPARPKLCVFRTTWENPFPEKVIESIDLVSAGEESSVFVLAITVE